MRIILIAALILVIMGVAAYPLELSRMVLTRDIKDNEPADSDSVFFLVEGAIFCFTEFKDIIRPTRVIHKWYCNNQLVSSIELALKPARRWRTWSKKRFKNCFGQWLVQVLDGEGKVLAEKKFRVREF